MIGYVIGYYTSKQNLKVIEMYIYGNLVVIINVIPN